MCRMAAYLGPAIPLRRFLTDPPHSLYQQAWAPRELRYAKLNADGFGFGWFDPNGTPAVYVNPAPIWTDVNLEHLGRSMDSPLWLGYVRSATAGIAVNQSNTQPFVDGELMFMHNGFMRDFHGELRNRFLRALDDRISGEIRGNTDSEYLFALLRHILAVDPDMPVEDALVQACHTAVDWIGDRPALLNFIVSDGTRVYAVRHAVNDDCPSLYYTTDNEAFPGAQLVASERFDDCDFWQPVPEHQLLILDPAEPPELRAL